MLKSFTRLAVLALAVPAAHAQTDTWQWGAVLDITATSLALGLAQRDQGLALGHSDLSASGPIGQALSAQLTAAVHTHEGKTEAELEEAWLQTRNLPWGLQARAGRFASQLGYLNEQHPHADDFVERPLMYRAFLGGHWNDDGLRLNWTAPTPRYLRLGAEVFRGKRLIEHAERASNPGVSVLSARLGDDLGASHSWQAGFAFVQNRRQAEAAAHGHEDGHDDESDEEHDHGHGALYSGKRMQVWDVTWKWAPDGNNSQRQLRVGYERAVVHKPNHFATAADRHVADHLAVVWRFSPTWEVGTRLERLRVAEPHGDHFHSARLRQTSLMLAYKPGHMQTVRLQVAKQTGSESLAAKGHSVQLQYVLNWGAHAAHSF
ncbi:MAG TPA: hypothetical protein VFW67_07350 [Burkholderiaceae bacterium]|nr:hypothetical protein [Burkholderiaceae bacterium]